MHELIYLFAALICIGFITWLAMYFAGLLKVTPEIIGIIKVIGIIVAALVAIAYILSLFGLLGMMSKVNIPVIKIPTIK